jgi:hypothetical protein
VVCISEDVRLAGQVIRRFGKAGQHAFEEHLEPLFGQCQAGRQGEELVFDLRIEAAKGTPSWLGYSTIAG